MKDNEIIKALELCLKNDIAECRDCVYYKIGIGCRRILQNDLFDLINRQKVEIKRLKKENKILSINADTAFQDGLNEVQDLYAEQVKAEVKSEAIKEFAERLESEYEDKTQGRYMNWLMTDIIDNLVKEMTEGESDV